MNDIETRDLWFSYSDDIPVLKALSVEIIRGDFLALIGQNGSGKTTLAKHLLGLLRPSQGTVLIQGEDIAEKTVGEMARRVGFVFQNPDHQIFSPTIREEIAYGPLNLRLEQNEIDHRTEKAMERFDLVHLADRQPATLSYGTRRKVAIASIYAMDPQIWILDEPTGGLDWRSEQETMSLLHELNEEGKTIVLITHDMRLVAEHAQRCLVLSGGEAAVYGTVRQVMEQNVTLHITPPQVWRLAHELDLRPHPLSVEEFCSTFGRHAAVESEINVDRA